MDRFLENKAQKANSFYKFPPRHLHYAYNSFEFPGIMLNEAYTSRTLSTQCIYLNRVIRAKDGGKKSYIIYNRRNKSAWEQEAKDEKKFKGANPVCSLKNGL